MRVENPKLVVEPGAGRTGKLAMVAYQFQHKTSVEYKRCLGWLEAKMQKVMEETMKETPTLKKCLPRFYGANYAVDRLWVRVAN
jgi:hypothetical protein